MHKLRAKRFPFRFLVLKLDSRLFQMETTFLWLDYDQGLGLIIH
jgi:hypothetical protein